MSVVNVETGEVIQPGTVVPFDASVIEQAADPGKFVELACARAKEWLAEALTRGDIEGIVELKSQAEAIRTYTAQKQLGKDAELSAQEIVRRAERGIGLAIRRGQETGEIAGKDAGPQARVAKQTGDTSLLKPTPTDFVPSHELSSNSGNGIYGLTDGVTDEQFEAAIEDGKAEENLSRANVIRKAKGEPRKRKWTPEVLRETLADLSAKGYTSQQIASALDMSEGYVRDKARTLGVTIQADVVRGRTRRLDSDRIVGEMTNTLEALAMSVDLVTPADLDPERIAHWATSLTASLKTLNRFGKQIKEVAL